MPAKDREARLITSRKTYAKHAEEVKEKVRAYKEKHPEVVARYRAKGAIAQKEKYRNLPPVVYRYTSRNGACIYVGRGSLYRAGVHRHRSKWFSPDYKLKVHVCHSEADAMRQEGVWIMKYKPINNKEGYRR